jgi:hypothetical protein
MPALPELQARFAASLLGQDATGVAGAVAGDGLAPAARIQVYWNHVFTSLTAALEATYPVVCRLVDRRFFGFAADSYIRHHPPADPCLFQYGATFPEFLETFPPCAGHPYLADVARLEWAMSTALHAEDATPIAPAALGTVRPEDLGRLVVRADPSASWLRSPWPVDRIWLTNQPGADPAKRVDLDEGEALLEIRRRQDAVAFRRLDPPEFAFRSALGAGVTLEAAADSALRRDPAFDLPKALRSLLGEAVLVGLPLAAELGRREWRLER